MQRGSRGFNLNSRRTNASWSRLPQPVRNQQGRHIAVADETHAKNACITGQQDAPVAPRQSDQVPVVDAGLSNSQS